MNLVEFYMCKIDAKKLILNKGLTYTINKVQWSSIARRILLNLRVSIQWLKVIEIPYVWNMPQGSASFHALSIFTSLFLLVNSILLLC